MGLRNMKKIFLLTVCVLIFAGPDSFGREKLANEDKSGLYARSIEQVLRLDEEEIDLATAVLIISEQWNDNVYGRRYISKLDDMAFEIRARLKAKKLRSNYRAVAVINEYLFDELRFTPLDSEAYLTGFKSVCQAANPNDLLLHSVLDRKRGYCLSLSILYLSIGERLGLPLHGVVVPGHFFVRYDDGQVRFNIETTSKGGYADDEHYINKFNVPEANNDSIYMVNLNKMQTLGCFFNNLGNSYNDTGDMETALVALERAVEINPSLAESRTNLGNVYLKKERIEDAIYEYLTALKINPGDARTHNNLGNAYTKRALLEAEKKPLTGRGWLNDAISHYTRSLALNPNYIDAYKNMAIAYCKLEMFAKAQSALRQALALEPKNASCYNQLGDVHSQRGDFEEAIFQYKKALKFKANLAEAHYGLGICYNKLGSADDEIQAYKRALAVEPNMAVALINLGNAYFGKQNYDAAIEQYKKAIQIKPDEGTLHYNLGAAYSNKGLYEQAVAEYKKVVEIEPEMADAHNGLAFSLYKLKKYDLAWKHIRIAEKLGADISEDVLAAIEDKLATYEELKVK